MTGVLIREGVSDWQIFQQKNGFAEIKVAGTWEYEAAEDDIPQVYLCVKKEDSGEPVIWWRKCNSRGQSWDITVDVPAGGLYQIETCLVQTGEVWSEWAIRGDIVSHIGVGDLYVIAGQSNASGYGKDYVYDPPEMGVHILKNNLRWSLASHPLQDATGCAVDPVNMDAANTGHSLYLSFAKYLKRELHYPIGLIQTSRGGAGLAMWSPGNGELYVNMLERIRLAGGSVKGIVWYQGCTDGTSGLCETYYDRFLEMKNALCRDLNVEYMDFLICQLNKCNVDIDEAANEAWGILREQLRRLGDLEQIYTVPTTDCAISDCFGHNTAKSNVILGERLAKVALTHIYGKKFLCDAPDIQWARKVGKREILLEFAHVYDKLELFRCEPEKLAFTVEDCRGTAELSTYDIPKANQILLHFQRELDKGCVIHGAYEKNLSKVVPVDFATHLPMLSFYGLKVDEGGVNNEHKTTV